MINKKKILSLQYNLKIKKMEFKGTKGKWHIKKNGPNILDENNESVVCWYGVATSTFLKKEEEHKANALLISKAPEMLEMLKELRESILSEDNIKMLASSQKAKELIIEATQLN